MKEEPKQTRQLKYQHQETKDIKENTQDNKEQTNKTSIIKKILITIIIFIILLIIYICTIGISFITINEYKIESSYIPESFNGIKIVHFSDIHYGTTINKKELDKIVTKINELKPDIIIFTGDLIDKNITVTDEIKEEVISSLSNLECSLYKYAIYGDEDINNESYEEIMNNLNFTILNNESTLLYYKDTTPIEIIGFKSSSTNPDYSIISNNIEDIDSISLYKIILSHEPDTIDELIEYDPQLVLSGHSLGGLIKLPFLKPVFLNEGATKYYKEYYKINNTDLYISNGLGTSGLNIRFNNRPSINLYRLSTTKESS